MLFIVSKFASNLTEVRRSLAARILSFSPTHAIDDNFKERQNYGEGGGGEDHVDNVAMF